MDRRTHHHETVVRLVLVLRRTLPLALLPLLVKQKAEVLVPGNAKVSAEPFYREPARARYSREGRRRVLQAERHDM